MKVQSHALLSKEEQELLSAAERAMEHAYCPYSGFPVGCAVRTKNNAIFTAANMENASFGLSICAESGAIQTAFSAGERTIRSIAIIASSDIPAMPCGRCRQLIREAQSQKDTEEICIIISNKNKNKILLSNIEELLPYPFDKDYIQ
jgi:cytidine deaminase